MGHLKLSFLKEIPHTVTCADFFSLGWISEASGARSFPRLDSPPWNCDPFPPYQFYLYSSSWIYSLLFIWSRINVICLPVLDACPPLSIQISLGHAQNLLKASVVYELGLWINLFVHPRLWSTFQALSSLPCSFPSHQQATLNSSPSWECPCTCWSPYSMSWCLIFLGLFVQLYKS